MRTIILFIFCSIIFNSFSQEKNRIGFIIPSYHFVYENVREIKTNKFQHSYIIQAGLNRTKPDFSGSIYDDVRGSGFEINVGNRTYFNKKDVHKGFFAQNFLTYGQLKYKTTVLDERFTGTYKYLSFFNPEVGYKVNYSKRITMDISFGYSWRIEFKPSGEIDNRLFNNWQPKLALSANYGF
uniref:hypothetical protein n=2 Tax=Flavobacterium sp. TaxID=239 RepID=UPI0040497842